MFICGKNGLKTPLVAGRSNGSSAYGVANNFRNSGGFRLSAGKKGTDQSVRLDLRWKWNNQQFFVPEFCVPVPCSVSLIAQNRNAADGQPVPFPNGNVLILRRGGCPMAKSTQKS